MAATGVEKIIKDLLSYYGKGAEKLNFSFEKVKLGYVFKEKTYANIIKHANIFRKSLKQCFISGIIPTKWPLLVHFAVFRLIEHVRPKVPVTQITGKNEVQGLRNLVSQFSNPVNPEYEIIQDQWVEYILTHMGNMESSTATQVLKELNNHISDKVFFVGNELGPIDILVYYLMYSTVLNLTYQEKEKYIHFSRWFNNVQQYGATRLGRSVIPFSRTPLYI